MSLLQAAQTARENLRGLDVPKTTYSYHPLDYAWEAHAAFLARYGGNLPRRALFVGMNPGYWGMGQTGVPFADAPTVREWMGFEARVGRPVREHPKRPVLGFASARKDPSGQRFYGWARERCGSAEAFFREFFVINYCPLLFFDAEGANVTPPQLPKPVRESLFPACDAHLAEVVRATGPEWIFPLGDWVAERVRAVAEREAHRAKVHPLLHPSPANPLNNRGWGGAPDALLDA